MTKTALIIGGGFAGCAAAHLLALQGGWDVTLVESAPFLGGGCKTMWYGGHPYTFGPRHFLTQNPAIYEYLNKYCPLRRCQEHMFLTYVAEDENFYHYPIHVDDIPRMPDAGDIHQELSVVRGGINARNLEEFWIDSVGKTLYRKFVERYSRKMWQVESNAEIDHFSWSPKGVTLKSGSREAWDTAISAYPHAPDGYDGYFAIATEGARVLMNTRIDSSDIPAKTAVIKGESRRYDAIVNTISPDLLFGACYGPLPYIGRDFHKIVLPVARAFPENVYFLYYAGDEKFTRLVEYKQMTRQNWDKPTTIIGMEIPSLNGRYYPMPIKSCKALAQKYFDLMPDGVVSIGRAGSYQYEIDIGRAIDQAQEAIGRLK